MKNYQVDFSYKVEEYGTVTLGAMDREEADEAAREYVRETFEDAMSISIDDIKEIQ